jgi:hypothetical protein
MAGDPAWLELLVALAVAARRAKPVASGASPASGAKPEA